MNDSDRLLHNLHQTTRVIARGINRVLEPWGLSSSEWSLIRALKLHGPQTQRSLAAFLHIEPPAITKSLARLEQRGLIDRSEGMDRRTKTTSLSERALQLYPHWEQRIREHRSSLLAGLCGGVGRRGHCPAVDGNRPHSTAIGRSRKTGRPRSLRRTTVWPR